MKNKGLTFTVIFRASSLNYGDSMGNEAVLKTVTLPDGNTYARVSRQALLYEIRRQFPDGYLAELGQDSSDKSVIQYSSKATIDKYPEIDLLGYMKTEKGAMSKTRSAVARVSDAVALTPYKYDHDFLTNMGLAQRLIASTHEPHNNSIASSDIDTNYYAYTVTIDLNLIGVDKNDGIEIPKEKRAERVNTFMDVIDNLYRDIRGRREDLHPLFIVGGLYDKKRPYFMNKVKMTGDSINVEPLSSGIPEGTVMAYDAGAFKNEDLLASDLGAIEGVDKAFEDLKEKVSDYYAN